MFAHTGLQYRTETCSWGGKQCFGFRRSNVKMQNFCDEPIVKRLFCDANILDQGYELKCSKDSTKNANGEELHCELCYNGLRINNSGWKINRSSFKCMVHVERKFR